MPLDAKHRRAQAQLNRAFNRLSKRFAAIADEHDQIKRRYAGIVASARGRPVPARSFENDLLEKLADVGRKYDALRTAVFRARGVNTAGLTGGGTWTGALDYIEQHEATILADFRARAAALDRLGVSARVAKRARQKYTILPERNGVVTRVRNPRR